MSVTWNEAGPMLDELMRFGSVSFETYRDGAIYFDGDDLGTGAMNWPGGAGAVPLADAIAEVHARRLLDRVPSLTVETDDAEPLTISHALLPVGQRARGAPEVSSVDGVLDVISVRGQMVVTVTEHVTGRRIRCLIGGDMLERAKAALGRRVVVEGTVAFTAAGAPRLVSEVSEIFVRPEPDGSIVELLGSLPDFSGGLSSGEYVRRMREGEDDET